MTGDKAVRVTGYVKNLYRGMTWGKAFRQYAPVYSGHHYVREQQMNGAGVLLGYLLGFSPVRCRQNLVPVVSQKHMRQFAQRFCVFYQQNGLGSTNGQRHLAALAFGCNGLFDTWQVNVE